jgi:hypothetical protein
LKATYNLSGNFLQERLPEELNPERHDANAHPDLYDEYKRVSSSLRTIPCSEECKSVFRDGGVYEQGKDYEVGKKHPDETDVAAPQLVAYPLSQTVQEEATIEDYKQVLVDHGRLVRELDVIINGENAAKQASLCDIVSQCKDIFKNPVNNPLPTPIDENELQKEAEALFPFNIKNNWVTYSYKKHIDGLQRAYTKGRKVNLSRIKDLEAALDQAIKLQITNGEDIVRLERENERLREQLIENDKYDSLNKPMDI